MIVIQVTAANVQDHYQIYDLIVAGKKETSQLEKVWVDQGYQSNKAAREIEEELKVDLEIVPKPEGKKGFQILPRRWVVERTFAWLCRYRRLSKDYEYQTCTSEAWIQLAMSRLMLRRLSKQGG